MLTIKAESDRIIRNFETVYSCRILFVGANFYFSKVMILDWRIMTQTLRNLQKISISLILLKKDCKMGYFSENKHGNFM